MSCPHPGYRFFTLVLGFAVLSTAGCAERPESAETAAQSTVSKPEPASPVSEAPSAPNAPSWLSRLRTVHTQADAAAASGPSKRDARKKGAASQTAIGAIANLYAAPPPPQLSADELLPLRRDLADRAARLELAQGNPRAALTWTSRGLSLSDAPGVFRANLLLTAADAHQALGQGDDARAALLQALQVNQQLLDRELENP